MEDINRIFDEDFFYEANSSFETRFNHKVRNDQRLVRDKYWLHVDKYSRALVSFD